MTVTDRLRDIRWMNGAEDASNKSWDELLREFARPQNCEEPPAAAPQKTPEPTKVRKEVDSL